jgi:hypothetical protein
MPTKIALPLPENREALLRENLPVGGSVLFPATSDATVLSNRGEGELFQIMRMAMSGPNIAQSAPRANGSKVARRSDREQVLRTESFRLLDYEMKAIAVIRERTLD